MSSSYRLGYQRKTTLQSRLKAGSLNLWVVWVLGNSSDFGITGKEHKGKEGNATNTEVAQRKSTAGQVLVIAFPALPPGGWGSRKMVYLYTVESSSFIYSLFLSRVPERRCTTVWVKDHYP